MNSTGRRRMGIPNGVFLIFFLSGFIIFFWWGWVGWEEMGVGVMGISIWELGGNHY